MKQQYLPLIKQFSRLNVLIIGEAFLDRYVYGSAERICREAPVPVVALSEHTDVPGGAANTAVNVAALGATTHFLSVVGHDADASTLINCLSSKNVQTETLFLDPSRQTISKERVVADNHIVVRCDKGSTTPLSDETEKKMIDYLIDHYSDFDAVIISDYGYGILSDKVITTLEKLQKYVPQLLVIDAKHLEKYRTLHPTAVKPNYAELITLLSLPEVPKEERIPQILAAQEQIMEVTGAEIAAVTVDTQGALILEKEKHPYRTYAHPADAANAVGAGDTFTSAFTLALAAAARSGEAAEIAQAATSVIIREPGTTLCSFADLQSQLQGTDKEISTREQLRSRVRQYRSQGYRIVFTNGCFDILHSGHVTYLKQAKELGDILILGINSDESIKRLKGPERPINALEDRMQVLAGLESIDLIVPFETDTPIHLIEEIKPDIYVKGGDYTRETLPETPVVEKYGGKVEIIPFVRNRSTTNIIKKIRAVYTHAQQS